MLTEEEIVATNFSWNQIDFDSIQYNYHITLHLTAGESNLSGPIHFHYSLTLFFLLGNSESDIVFLKKNLYQWYI